MLKRTVPLIALVGALSTVVPASGTPPTLAVAPAQAPAAAVGTTVSLPAPSDPTWTKVFEDNFTRPHQVATDPADGTSLYTVDGRVVWRNLGLKPTADKGWVPRPISDCAPVDTAAGILTLKAFPNDNPDYPDTSAEKTRWRCRITSNAQFGNGTHIFAARLKLHTSTGHLSSFWLNTDARSGQGINEIDVIETSGSKSKADGCVGAGGVDTNTSAYYGLNHSYYSRYTPRTGYKHCLSRSSSTALLDDSFHTVHAELTPKQSIKFYVDGSLSATLPAEYAVDTPLNVILTNILKTGSASGKDVQVRWVKVWKKVTPPPPPPPPSCNDNECWRAQLGTYSYSYPPNSNPADPRLDRIIFDRRFYLERYPNVRAWAEQKKQTQGGTIFQHAEWYWLTYGAKRGEQGSATFDPKYYMAAQPDVAKAYGDINYEGVMSHYLTYGRYEGRRASELFDPRWYRARYGDIAAAGGVDFAVWHFTVHGMDEGRQGAAGFAPAWYLGVNTDLRASYGNNYRAGMTHWLAHGRAEGRRGTP